MAAEPEISRALRVGFIVHSMAVAGAEIFVSELLARSQGRVAGTILCLDAVGELGDDLRRAGAALTCLERRPGVDWRLPRRIASEVRRRKIEILHAQQYTPFFYAALAVLFSRRTRVILTEHGRHYPDRVSWQRRWVNKALLAPRADAIIACSDFSRKALAVRDGFPRERIQVIANGVAIEKYRTAADRTSECRAVGLDPDRRYVGTIARFHPVKDHATLVRAFARLAPSAQDVDLLLVGDGPLKGKVESLVAELGLRQRVRFLGVRADIPRLLQVLNVFLLTSLSEGASLTLLEAMAAARPIVATAVGGTPEIVRQGIDGLLVDRGDDRAAAESTLRLLEDPALADRTGRAARRRVEHGYRLEHTVEAYLRLYKTLASGGGDRRSSSW